MNFDLNDIYKMFDKVKDKADFKEYCNELEENGRILKEIPFNVQSAQQQISKLASKYRFELNLLSNLYSNNMNVTNQPISKPPEILWNDLQYIDRHIPLFALERKGISDFLKQKVGP